MSYGLEVYSENDVIVWSSGIRTTNIGAFQSFSLSPNQELFVSCANANDNSKIKITFISGAFTVFPTYLGIQIISRTSSGFTLKASTSLGSSGTVIAMRVS
jgi:hypothetical protein